MARTAAKSKSKSTSSTAVTRWKKRALSADDATKRERKRRREVVKAKDAEIDKAPLRNAGGAIPLEAAGLVVTSGVIGVAPKVGPVPTDLVALIAGAGGTGAGFAAGSHHVVNASKGVMFAGLANLIRRGGEVLRTRAQAAAQSAVNGGAPPAGAAPTV